MKIAFAIPDLSMGGAQRSLVKLANVLAGQGQQILIVSFGNIDPAVAAEVAPSVRIVTLFVHRTVDPRLLPRLIGLLRRESVDELVGWSLYANFAAVIAGRVARVPRIVISERNYVPLLLGPRSANPRRRRLLCRLIQLLYPLAHLVTANSTDSLRFLRRYLRRANDLQFAQLPNLAEVSVYDRLASEPPPDTLKCPAKGPRIVAVGRLHEQKGFDILLHAMARLPTDVGPWEVTIAGEGPARAALLDLRTNLGLGERVHFVGRVDNPFPLYAWADIVVVPSRFEGFPNVPLEAMALGRAVVVADCRTGPREMTLGGRLARLVRTEDPQSLADALQDLGENPQAIEELGRSARAHIESTYGPSTIQAIYMRLLASP